MPWHARSGTVSRMKSLPGQGLPTPHGADLPAEVVRGAHTRPTLARAGVTPGQLRGPLWVQAGRGLWAWSATDPEDPGERARRAGALVSGKGAVGGWAAAHLHGATELDGWAPDGGLEPVLLCVRPDQRCRRQGAHRVWRSRLDPADVVDLDGVPVTSVVRTCIDLARLGRLTMSGPSTSGPSTSGPSTSGPRRLERRRMTIPDLRPGTLEPAVVAVDVLRRMVGVDVDQVLTYLADRPRLRGSRQARAVLSLSEPNTRSAGETRLRMLWVGDAGLPRPRSNQSLRVRGGPIVAEVDLLDVEAGLVGEYDGEVHAGADRRSRDVFRAERLVALGLQVIRVTAVDLRTHRERTVERLRHAHADGLRRDRSRDGWELA
jgi:hypothetical protein